MSRLTRWLAPTTTARAHCDLPCGVYDPEQARIEAESCYRIIEKYAANEDADVPDPRHRDQGGAGGARQAPPRRPVARLLQARAPRGGPEPARAVLEREQAGLEGQGLDRHRRRQEAARHDRRDRRRLEGDRRRRRRRASPADPADIRPVRIPRPRRSAGPRRTESLRHRLRGPWRLAVTAGQHGAGDPARATGCSSTRRRPAGRAAARSWRSASPTAARWRSSASPADPGDRVPFARRLPRARPTTRRGCSPTPTPPTTAAAGLGEPIDSRPLRAGAGRAARGPRLVPVRAAAAGSGGLTIGPWTPGTRMDRLIARHSPHTRGHPDHDRHVHAPPGRRPLASTLIAATIAACGGKAPAAAPSSGHRPRRDQRHRSRRRPSRPTVGPRRRDAGESLATTGRIEFADKGFAVTLPDGWTRIDLSADDIDQLHRGGRRCQPRSGRALFRADQGDARDRARPVRLRPGPARRHERQHPRRPEQRPEPRPARSRPTWRRSRRWPTAMSLSERVTLPAGEAIHLRYSDLGRRRPDRAVDRSVPSCSRPRTS